MHYNVVLLSSYADGAPSVRISDSESNKKNVSFSIDTTIWRLSLNDPLTAATCTLLSNIRQQQEFFADTFFRLFLRIQFQGTE